MSVSVSLVLPPVTIPPGPWLSASVPVESSVPSSLSVLEFVSVSLVLSLSEVVLPPTSRSRGI